MMEQTRRFVAAALALLAGCADVQKTLAPLGSETAKGAATAATTALAPATTSADRVNPGAAGSGNKVVSSIEYDPKCIQLVKPFTLTGNFGDLAELTTSGAGQVVSDAIGKKGANPLASANGHKLSLEMRRAAVRMNWLPMSVEVMYGEHMHGQMEDDLLGRDEALGKKLYPLADALLAEILAKIDAPTDYRFKLFIRARPGENAMALPGGFVYIDKGLLDAPSKRPRAEFALAHEVSHVLQRHETRALQARIIDSYSMKGNLADLLKTIKSPDKEASASISFVLAGKLMFEQHFANQELQSDACAARLLDRVYGDDRKLREAIQAFLVTLPPVPPKAEATPADAKQQALTNAVDLVSRPIDRHPGTAQRVANLKVMVEEIRKRPATQRPG